MKIFHLSIKLLGKMYNNEWAVIDRFINTGVFKNYWNILIEFCISRLKYKYYISNKPIVIFYGFMKDENVSPHFNKG